MNDIEKYEAKKEYIKVMRKKVKFNKTYIKIRELLREVIGSNPDYINIYSMSVSCKYPIICYHLHLKPEEYEQVNLLIIDKLKEQFLKYNIQGIKIYRNPAFIINIPFKSILGDQY